MSRYRKIQKYENNQWKDIDFIQLKQGDKFRMFEPDGEIVKDKNNNTEFNAIGDVYFHEECKTWAIDIAEIDEIV